MQVSLFNKIITSNLLTAPRETLEPSLITAIDLENREFNERLLENRNSDTCRTICCCTFCGTAIITGLAMAIFGFWTTIKDNT